MKTILVAVFIVLAIPLLAVPQAASADPTQDQNFIAALRENGLRAGSDAGAISLAHIIVDGLVEFPTMDMVSKIADALVLKSRQQGSPTTQQGAPITFPQAAMYIRLSVHYYGPPGLEDTLDRQSQ